MCPMNTLSPRRSAILTFIRDRIAQQGLSPSLAEIAEAFGFASRSVARKHILALTEAGLIEVMPGQARGIRLVQDSPRPQMLEIPVLGRVAAGTPIGPDVGHHDTLMLDHSTFSRVPDYLLRVQGDSMIEDGILDGDLVGVHRSSEASDGQIVIARLDGEVTIKRLQKNTDSISLLPRNPAYAPIVVEPARTLPLRVCSVAWSGVHDGRCGQPGCAAG